MKLEYIEKILKQGESITLECKKSTAQLKEAVQTVCAFLNDKGGTVFIGVTPNEHRIIGQEISDKTKRDVYNVISKIEPSTDVDTEFIELPSGKYLIVFVAHPQKKLQPYTFDLMIYQRINSSTRKAPQAIQEQWYLKRNGYFDNWERLASPIQDIKQLDIDVIKEAIALAKMKTPDITPDNPENIKKILKKFRLINQDNQITNAAFVLFGADLQSYYPQCTMKMAVFKGREKTEDFVDKKRYCVNAFKALDIADRFFDMYIPKTGTFVEGDFQRKDRPIIPYKAYREALINALCHRNYYNPSGSISIAFYTDRLEISNTGELPPELSLKDLEQPHESYPRNATIAQVFDTCGLIESWGRGTTDMIKNCEKARIPKPIFKIQSSAFYVIFNFKEKTPQERINDAKEERAHVELNRRQKNILEIVNEYGEISALELQKKIENIHVRTLQRELKRLEDAGKIKRTGSTNQAYWKVI